MAATESKRSYGWVPVVLSIVLVVGFMGGAQLLAMHRLPNIPGKPIRSYTVSTERGSWVVLEDSLRMGGGARSMISARGYRLTVLDAATGKPAGTRIFDDEDYTSNIECWPARGAQLWCDTGKALLSVELPALATRANLTETLKGSGAHTLLPQQQHFGPGDLFLLYADGVELRVDAETLKTAPATQADHPPGDSDYKQCKTQSSLRVADGHLMFTSGPLHALALTKESYGDFTAPPSAPKFLRKDSQPDFLVTGDPSLILIDHDSSLDREARVHQLSRVDERGEAVRWALPIGAGGCEHTALVSHALVMGRHDAAMRALAIDLDSGKALWRFAYPQN